MPVISRQLVLKKLATAFPEPELAEQALRSLDRLRWAHDFPPHYVHLAIIKLSEGELWRLRELVKRAKKDPRDVIFPAEAPEQMRKLMEKPRRHWGELPRPKPPSPAKETAMRKRDQKQ
jgi:hypothetical protein